jgi:hypothetical protein
MSILLDTMGWAERYWEGDLLYVLLGNYHVDNIDLVNKCSFRSVMRDELLVDFDCAS